MKIYEVVDCTDDERYYTLGLFTYLDHIIAVIESTNDPNDFGSDNSQDEYFQLEIRERTIGWGDRGKLVYRRSWAWVFDDDNEDDDGRWKPQLLLDRRGVAEHACGGPQEACCIPGCLECGAKKTDKTAELAGRDDNGN